MIFLCVDFPKKGAVEFKRLQKPKINLLKLFNWNQQNFRAPIRVSVISKEFCIYKLYVCQISQTVSANYAEFWNLDGISARSSKVSKTKLKSEI